MKKKDLLKICAQNLFRHKTRTMLTALGVVLGCCSVIIMISIGIGMKESQEKALAQMGDLTIINVHKAGKSKAAAKLNKAAIHAIKAVEGVEAATPKLTAAQVPITVYAGRNRRYRSAYITLVGLEAEAAGRMGYQLTDGSWLGASANHVLVGKSFAYAFEDTKRPAGKNVVDMWGSFDGTGTPDVPPPYFDSMKTPLYIELESGKEDEKKLTYELTVDGRMKEDYSKGEETSMGIVFRLEILERQQEEEQAVRANQELVTAMSHDLRTPLTALLGYVDILSLHKEPEGQQDQYIRAIGEKAWQMKQLSDKLFEYFLVFRKGREEMRLQTVNGIEFLGQIVEESLFDMESEGFQIVRSSDEIDCVLQADVEEIRRVFGNIFSNLLKYADRSQPVQVCYEQETDRLTVSFRNAVAPGTDGMESSRIGLRTCAKIMEAHGGRFRCIRDGGSFEVRVEFPV